jgi:hypothetical protein
MALAQIVETPIFVVFVSSMLCCFFFFLKKKKKKIGGVSFFKGDKERYSWDGNI